MTDRQIAIADGKRREIWVEMDVKREICLVLDVRLVGKSVGSFTSFVAPLDHHNK